MVSHMYFLCLPFAIAKVKSVGLVEFAEHWDALKIEDVVASGHPPPDRSCLSALR